MALRNAFSTRLCLRLLLILPVVHVHSFSLLQRPQPPQPPTSTASCGTSLSSPTLRRTLLANGWTAGIAFTFWVPNSAHASAAAAAAAAAAANDDKNNNPFDVIRYELTNPQGGVAYMQACLQRNDFPALLEFTKQYDQVLRKSAMGKAKKLVPDTLMKEQATLASNAVTFDLIGINRASRKGRENKEEALKYLQELVNDVTVVLNMETSVGTTE